jgi:hypothetical protein
MTYEHSHKCIGLVHIAGMVIYRNQILLYLHFIGTIYHYAVEAVVIYWVMHNDHILYIAQKHLKSFVVTSAIYILAKFSNVSVNYLKKTSKQIKTATNKQKTTTKTYHFS